MIGEARFYIKVAPQYSLKVARPLHRRTRYARRHPVAGCLVGGYRRAPNWLTIGPGGQLRTTGLSTADIQCASVNMQPPTRAGFLSLDTDFDREFIVPDKRGQREMPAHAPDCPSNQLKLIDKLRDAELGP
ncbi:hypothetical protein [Mesorhizobium qingshengii]|uniref:hypothetical protein n=1 Tax=Mesorhizobium qingshengii TaxID=1165689 RepID=UPI0011600857|nr:hypothetical protein [Mesorhizobium qingshengii]